MYPAAGSMLDYLKFVETASYTDAIMLFGVRQYPDLLKGGAADFNTEGKFGLDWLQKMWDNKSQRCIIRSALVMATIPVSWQTTIIGVFPRPMTSATLNPAIRTIMSSTAQSFATAPAARQSVRIWPVEWRQTSASAINSTITAMLVRQPVPR